MVPPSPAPPDIQLNGDRPRDPQVHDDRRDRRVLTGGSLVAGEVYMDGGWDCEALDQLFYRILRARLDQDVGGSWRQLWNVSAGGLRGSA